VELFPDHLVFLLDAHFKQELAPIAFEFSALSFTLCALRAFETANFFMDDPRE
jgi:hypothetical protein